MTALQFCNRHSITCDAEYAETNPNLMAADDWPATHWRVTLRMGRRRMTTFYSTGMAHSGEPKVSDVLACLVSDANYTINNDTFEEWCAETGENPNSRKAERLFHAVKKSATKLRQFLGDAFAEAANIDD